MDESEKVVEVLEEFVLKYPDFIRLRASYANALSEINELDRAIEEFKLCVEKAPAIELVSLGLFHAYWNAKRVREAIDEMERFLLIGNSEDYERIKAGLQRELLM